MKPDRQRIAFSVLLFATLDAPAATTQYQYDALARLRRVVHDNGVITHYALDAAGNRTQVDDLPPVGLTAPASLTVPATNNSGAYLVTWSASSGTVLRYELAESASPSFDPQTVLYASEARITVVDKASGTYYYRVRACGGAACTAYTVAPNPVVVTLPPPAPQAPQNARASLVASCVWRATWDAVPGAAHYRLRESVGVERTVVGTEATVVCRSGSQNENKPDRVRACNSAGICGPTTTFPGVQP